MDLFLSHSIADDDGPVASRLKAVAAAYGLRVLLPERGSSRKPNRATRDAIQGAAAVLALVSEDSPSLDAVDAELAVARESGKPVIALLEEGVALRHEPDHVVRFDRDDPASHEEELGEALAALAREQERAALPGVASWSLAAAALGALAAIAIGLLGLAALATALAPGEDEAEG